MLARNPTKRQVQKLRKVIYASSHSVFKFLSKNSQLGKKDLFDKSITFIEVTSDTIQTYLIGIFIQLAGIPISQRGFSICCKEILCKKDE